MNRRYLILVILITKLVGCSWHTNLIIINETDGPVTLIYNLKLHNMRPKEGEPCCPKAFLLEPPKILNHESFSALPHDFPSHAYEYDNTIGQVITVIPAGAALWVDSISNYSGKESSDGFYYSHMNVNKIAIRTKNRTITYEGVDILKAFKRYYSSPFNNSAYVLKIR